MVQNVADRYAPAMAVFFGGMTAMAVDFGVTVLRGGSPITPEIYGPAIYTIPALAWIGIQICVSAFGLIGSLYRNMAGDVLCLIGAFLSLVLYSAFSYMALSAPQGSLLAAGSRSFVAPCCFFAIFVAGAGINARRT